MKKAQMSAPLTVLYAGVAGSNPTEKEQKFVPFSFIHETLYLYNGFCELSAISLLGQVFPKLHLHPFTPFYHFGIKTRNWFP